MNFFNKLLEKIPTVLSGKLSIFIFLFIFCYLIIFGLICIIIPIFNDFAPPDKAQLILGNYTNIVSALGASIVAGKGVAIHQDIKKLQNNHKEIQDRYQKFQENHRELADKLDRLHKKIDKIIPEEDSAATGSKPEPGGE